MTAFSRFLRQHHRLSITMMVAVMLTGMFTAAITSVRNDSMTGDEIIYSGAGYSHWLYHRFDINYESAPLMKLWMSVPLFFLHPQLQESELNTGSEWSFGQNFFFQHGNDTDAILFWSRFMIILLMIGLGIFLFWGIQRWWGTKTALLSLFFYSFSPNILAHGRLATLDFGVSAFMFVATYFFIEWLSNNTTKNAILSGLFLGLAQLSKFSALILLPIFFLLLIGRIISRSSHHFKKEWKKIIQSLLLMACATIVVIWGVYFEVSYRMTPLSVFTKIEETTSDGKTPLPQVVRPALEYLNQHTITRPLAVYGVGVVKSLNYSRGPITNFPQYLFGHFNDMGWWWYYLAGFLIKEPIAIQLLFFIGGVFALHRWLRRGNKKGRNSFESYVWLTLLGITLLMMSGNLNIGLRYFLPAFCFVYILTARYVIQLLEQAKNRVKKVGQTVLAICMIWIVAANGFIYPSYLAYFNEWIEGPRNGYAYLIDSNIDWGQDLARLKSWVQEQHITSIYLDYFGQANPTHYLKDVQYTRWSVERGLPDGYLAVSTTILTVSKYWETINNGQSYRALDNLEPVARIGYSINVYDLRTKK